MDTKILVIDIEATCWEDYISKPKKETSEIIEIGVCELDYVTGDIDNAKSFIIKPTNSKISNYCTKLTSITKEQASKGINFREACNKLKKEYLSQDRTWASFGIYDRRRFSLQCRFGNINYPFSRNHIDVKELVKLKTKIQDDPNMTMAMQLLNVEQEGQLHRALYDSINTAKILRTIL